MRAEVEGEEMGLSFGTGKIAAEVGQGHARRLACQFDGEQFVLGHGARWLVTGGW